MTGVGDDGGCGPATRHDAKESVHLSVEDQVGEPPNAWGDIAGGEAIKFLAGVVCPLSRQAYAVASIIEQHLIARLHRAVSG